MSKHSPGPWRWDERYWIDLLDADGAAVLIGELGFMPSEEDHRLIAAAPELLEAIKRRVEDCGCIYAPHELCAQDRALIARIEGP